MIEFPKELPISARVADIQAALRERQVIIVAGATGSGKTTQLPKIALAMDRQRIGLTQPRRIAATSVADRIATELGTSVGDVVGYQIRFQDRTSRNTRVKLMTDGILLAEIQGDRLLRRYDTLIIDEAHERSLTIDFLLGWLKRILPDRRDLKVIISSATIETERFSQFFANAPVIQVEGRTYPVDVLYEPPDDDDDGPTAVAKAVANVTDLDPNGDILVFLPGEREIRETEAEIAARNLKHTTILPLYARLSAGEQSRVFQTIAGRRVILATNVAETSLTLPGIVYVIDAGVARLSRYDSRSGTTRLQIEAISQASADQRKGRCGRVRDGICVRLYDEQSFASRPAFTDPEIKRTGLAGVILRMKSLDLGDVDDFPFLDPPTKGAIAEGYRVLEELGAIDDQRALTPLGQRIARFPVDPRIARMILAGAEQRCLREILVITAALSTQDPRDRPRELQQKADDLHKRFRDERSDFAGTLKLWAFVQEAARKGTGNLRRTCRDNFLSFMRVREWTEVHRQLEEIVRDLKLEPNAQPAADDDVHKALLTGLLSKVGLWVTEKRHYMGSKQTRFVIHPSSGLGKKPPEWVMAFELVETTQLFARGVAKIDPEWLYAAAPHLVKRSYGEPHWSEKAARASCKENATLYGLPVARDKSVDYATVSPVDARRIFIIHALVRGEYKTKAPFQEKNRALFHELARLRDKARKSDMLADDEALYRFFDTRVPAHVVNGKTFEEWREREPPHMLVLSLDDLLVGGGDHHREPASAEGDGSLRAADYPDSLELHGVKVGVSYRFDPSADDDGITLTLPLVLLPTLDPGELDWTIPGWHKEKIEALIESLPKATRKAIAPIPELAAALAQELRPFDGPMLPALARAIEASTGVRIEPAMFAPATVLPHLDATVRIVDERGKELASGRDKDELLERYGAKARAVLQTTAPVPEWERRGITTWDFGALPEVITRRVGKVEVRSFPAIADNGASVDLVLCETRAEAEERTTKGVRRLWMIAAKQPLSTIAPRLPPAFTKTTGPGDDKSFRAQLLARIVDDAFGGELPRSKETFAASVTRGLPRLDTTFRAWCEAIAPVSAALNKCVSGLRAAAKHPSGKAAIDDMISQVDALVPGDLLATVSRERLGSYPRYLKAIDARLQRAVNDPRKDLEKLAPLSMLMKALETKKKTARDQDGVTALRWALEELRVAIFAPELRAAEAMSAQKLAAAIEALS